LVWLNIEIQKDKHGLLEEEEEVKKKWVFI